MRRLLPLALALWPALAGAQQYRLPVSDCSSCAHAPLYATAYMDLDTATGTIQDWNCGQKTYDGHKGTDIAIGGFVYMDQGSMEVVAGADGDVIFTHDGEDDRCDTGHCGNGDSNSVAIRHADGKVTTYLHMIKNSLVVSVGDHVTCGQKLGLVGSSGWSSGPHCHFEVDLGGAYLVNPDDPFASSCGAGGTLSYWVDQGQYWQSSDPYNSNGAQLPGALCDGQQPATTASSTSVASSTAGSTGAASTGSSASSSAASTSGGSTGAGSTSAASTAGATTGSGASGSSTGAGSSTGGTTGQPAQDEAAFIDETVNDGTVFPPGGQVTKSWRLLNTGTTRWNSPGYALVRTAGDDLGAPARLEYAASERTDPGQVKSWAVGLSLPQQNRSYSQTWQMSHDGVLFGPTLTVQIIVRAGTDADGDGHVRVDEGGDDCDDADPLTFAGAPEICDGKDNNCDGQTDEGLVRACGTACGAGQQTCTAGAWGSCLGEGTGPEVCDGLDNDCNHLVDDGAPCPTGQVCAGGACVPIANTTGTSGGSTGSAGATGSSGSTGASPPPAAKPSGCGCASAGPLDTLGLLVLAGALRRRRG